MNFNIRGYCFRIPYPFLLLLAALLSFWQFAFFQNGLKWDIQNVMVPWRYYAGECLQHGIFPLWNPYQQFGYPFFADLQYTNWNPEVWIIGNLFGYRYETFYFLIFFYIWMAGIGMYELAFFLSKKKSISFFLSLSWMLSGCVSGHLQQFVTVMGIAWLPFVVWQFLAFLKSFEWKNVAGFSLFSFLLMSTGYQALYFMLFYFFLVLGCVRLVEVYREDKKKLRVFITRSTALIILTLVLMLPIIVAVKQSTPFVSRLDEGVTLEEALLSPFSPQCTISLLLPVIAAKWKTFIQTDITLSNLFFGGVALILFFDSLRKKPDRFQKILLAFSVIFLLASFGSYTPLRKLLYDFVPLMDMFRLPGLFRIVVLLFLLMYIAVFHSRNEISWRFLMRGTGLLILFYIASSCWSWQRIRNSSLQLLRPENNLFYVSEKASPYELIFYQSVFFLFICILFICYLLWKREQFKFSTIILFNFLFLFSATQFNFYLNCGSNQHPSYTKTLMENSPKGFPLPYTEPVEVSVGFEPANNCVFSNTGILLKKPMPDEFSSFQFKGFTTITDEFSQVRKELQHYPIAYLSDSVYSTSSLYSFRSSIKNERKITFASMNSDVVFKNHSDDKIICKTFLPNRFSFDVENKQPVILNLQQTYFTGWEILVNGKSTSPIINAGLLMSVPLNAGKNSIEFIYQNNLFLISYVISLTLFFLLLGWFCWQSFLHNRIFFALLILILPAIATAHFFFFPAPNEPDFTTAKKLIQKFQNSDTNTLITGDRYLEDRNQNPFVIRSDEFVNLQKAFGKIKNCSSDEFHYAWINHLPDAKITEYIQLFYPDCTHKKVDDALNGSCVYSRKGLNSPDFFKSIEWKHPADSVYFEDQFIEKNQKTISKDLLCEIGPKNHFGPALETNYFNLVNGKSNALLRFKFKLKANELPKRLLFYVSITSEMKPEFKWEQHFDPSAWMLSPDAWNEVSLLVRPNLLPEPDLLIKCYLENGEKKPVDFKDFRIEVLEN